MATISGRRVPDCVNSLFVLFDIRASSAQFGAWSRYGFCVFTLCFGRSENLGLKRVNCFPIFIVAIIIIIISIVIWSTWYMTTSTTVIIIITCHLLRIRVAVKNAGQLIYTSKPCCCVLYMNSENACGIRFTWLVSEDICAKLGICRHYRNITKKLYLCHVCTKYSSTVLTYKT